MRVWSSICASITLATAIVSCWTGDTPTCEPPNIENETSPIGLTVVVRDAVTHEPICGATVVAHDGAYHELFAGSASYRGSPCSGRYWGAEERAGDYEIDVSVSGSSFQPTTVRAVVTNDADGCHVMASAVSVNLTRPPQLIPGCAPGNVSTLVPSWRPPTGFNQGKCADAQSAAFVDCLSNLPDAATCKTFVANPANRACIDCALSPPSAPGSGPLVEGDFTIDVNEAGCIAEATDDVNGVGCSAKVLALGQCEQFACEANCPVPAGDDGTAFAALLACQKTSDTSACKAYADDAACAEALESAGSAAAVCAQTASTFADNAKAMVKLFCGGVRDDDAGASDAADGG